MATQTAISGSPALSRSAPAPGRRLKIKWPTVMRHVVLGIFALVIVLPIFWVLLLSVKSLPDAYQNEIFPKVYDFTHYGYSLAKIRRCPRTTRIALSSRWAPWSSPRSAPCWPGM